VSDLKLDMDGAPAAVLQGDGVQTGDIYSKAGGAPGFWWVIALKPNGDAIVLSTDMSGEITGAQRYGTEYLRRNIHRRVGRTDLPPPLNVRWEPTQ
jgi:hypothetical protein